MRVPQPDASSSMTPRTPSAFHSIRLGGSREPSRTPGSQRASASCEAISSQSSGGDLTSVRSSSIVGMPDSLAASAGFLQHSQTINEETTPAFQCPRLAPGAIPGARRAGCSTGSDRHLAVEVGLAFDQAAVAEAPDMRLVVLDGDAATAPAADDTHVAGDAAGTLGLGDHLDAQLLPLLVEHREELLDLSEAPVDEPVRRLGEVPDHRRVHRAERTCVIAPVVGVIHKANDVGILRRAPPPREGIKPREAMAAPCDWSHRRLVLAELLAHHAADLAQRGVVAERVPERIEQVPVAAADLAELLEAPAHKLLVPVLFEALEAGDLVVLGLGIDLEDVDLDLAAALGVLVDAHEDVLLGLDAAVVGERRFLDLALDESSLDRLHRAAELLHLFHQSARLVLDVGRESLDVVGPGERIDRVRGAGLVRKHLLGAKRDPRRVLGGQAQGLVEAVRVERLSAATDGGEALQRHADDVVLGLLGGQRRAAGLRVE